MKKIIALFISACFFASAIKACTTFFINKNGQLVFGRNYDWLSANGMVFSNQKGLSKISFPSTQGRPISWISKYGSISFNQYGKEFPTGGMNEKGLVVELMWLDGTSYPKPDNRPVIVVLQWIQYQLDNCATIEELVATDKILRIANSATPLHFLVADANGHAAAIEFLDGVIKVHKGDELPFPVLTNDKYSMSAKTVLDNTNASNLGNSMERFVTTCKMVGDYNTASITTPVIDYSFSILNKVAQENYTKWSIVYDITNKKVYFKTNSYPLIKNLSLGSFNFTCPANSLALDMNQPIDGNIFNLFKPFTLDMNQQLVNKSMDESVSQFTATEDERRRQWEFAGLVVCAHLIYIF